MIPALREQHEAHKARQARLGGPVYVPPALPKAIPAPPATPIKMPPVIDVNSTRKHQIMALSAAGYSQGRIARRLEISAGAVAGVLHRARAVEHKVLLGDVALAMFQLGFDTYDIAATIGEPEHVIVREMNRARQRASQ